MIKMICGAPEQYDKYYSFDIVDLGCKVNWKFALIGWMRYSNNSLCFCFIADATSVDELRIWADLHGIEVNEDIVKRTASVTEFKLYDFLRLQYTMKTRTPSMSKVNARS